MADPSPRQALAEATTWFIDVVAGVGADQWEEPGLGEWSVRELTAHTSRALTTVERYLADAEPDAEIELDSAAAYYTAAMALPDVHRAVAARAREQVGVLGDDPTRAVADLAERVTNLVAASGPAAPCATIVGVMALDDYLRTRVAELVLHTMDLARATGQVVSPPPDAARLVLATLVQACPDAAIGDVLAALTGRAELPGGFDVLRLGPTDD